MPFPNEETEFNLPDDIFDDVSNYKQQQQHAHAADSSVTSDEGMLQCLTLYVQVNSNHEHPPGQTPGICFTMSPGARHLTVNSDLAPPGIYKQQH